MEYTVKDKRLFLRLGDRVTHLFHEEWGEGAVVEERTSIVPGGTCLVRLLFEDGQQRTFNNDLDNEQCCYFFGLRRVMSVSLEDIVPPAVRARARRRALPAPHDQPVAAGRARARRSARGSVAARGR
jgi:hypothetical protein